MTTPTPEDETMRRDFEYQTYKKADEEDRKKKFKLTLEQQQHAAAIMEALLDTHLAGMEGTKDDFKAVILILSDVHLYNIPRSQTPSEHYDAL